MSLSTVQGVVKLSRFREIVCPFFGDEYLVGICSWSVYFSGWYTSLVGLFSRHSAEEIHLGVGDEGMAELVLFIT